MSSIWKTILKLLLIIIKNYFKGRYYYPMPSSSLTHNFY